MRKTNVNRENQSKLSERKTNTQIKTPYFAGFNQKILSQLKRTKMKKNNKKKTELKKRKQIKNPAW